MALDGKILARAREQIGHTHANNVAEHYLRQEKIYSQIPEIRRIDERLRTQMSELVGLTIKRSADLSDALKTLEDESLALQALFQLFQDFLCILQFMGRQKGVI